MISKAIATAIKKILEPHARNLRLMIGRVVVDIVDDTLGIQTIQASALAGEVIDHERFQNFGFTSNPVSQSAEGIAVYVGGNREHGVIIALDDRKFRLKGLTPGQVAMYDLAGTKVLLKADGKAEFFTLTELKLGNTVSVEPALRGLTFQGVFNSHVHVGNLGVLTAPPSAPSIPTDLSSSVQVGL